MPLTKKGLKILSSMEKTYGNKKKAEEVFYASKNKGKISKVEKTKTSPHNALPTKLYLK